MKRKPVPPSTVEELSGWPTKRLMGRLNALRRCEEDPSHTDRSPEEISGKEGICFKSDPRWKEAYRQVKSILDGREHLPRGKAVRQARARARR